MDNEKQELNNEIDLFKLNTDIFLNSCSDSELIIVNNLLNENKIDEAKKIINDFAEKFNIKEDIEEDDAPKTRGQNVKLLTSLDIKEAKKQKELKLREEAKKFQELIDQIKKREEETKERNENMRKSR